MKSYNINIKTFMHEKKQEKLDRINELQSEMKLCKSLIEVLSSESNKYTVIKTSEHGFDTADGSVVRFAKDLKLNHDIRELLLRFAEERLSNANVDLSDLLS